MTRLLRWSGHDAEGDTVSGEVPVQVVHHITLADDGTDQTVPLQQQINAVPDGTPGNPSIIQLPAGRWWTEGNLASNPRGTNGIVRLHNRHHLILQGPPVADLAADGCTLYTKAPAVPYSATVPTNTHSLRRHVYLTNCSNVTVRNLRIEGSNYTEGSKLTAGSPAFWEGGADTGALNGYPGYRAGWETEHAFAIHDSTDVTLEDFAVFAVWGDGVYVGNHAVSQRIITRRGHIRFAGRQGIAAAAVDGWLIEDVWIDKGRRAGIDLEPHLDRLFCRNVEIRGCRVEPMQTVYAGLGRGDVSNVWIHHNTERTTGTTIACGDSQRITRRRGWRYEHNTRHTTFGSPASPIQFVMTDDVVIHANRIPVQSTQSQKCVEFTNCQGSLVVTDNNFRRTTDSLGGCHIVTTNSAPVTATGNIFGTNCPVT